MVIVQGDFDKAFVNVRYRKFRNVSCLRKYENDQGELHPNVLSGKTWSNDFPIVVKTHDKIVPWVFPGELKSGGKMSREKDTYLPFVRILKGWTMLLQWNGLNQSR